MEIANHYKLLAKDPLTAHKKIIAEGGYPALCRWVKEMAMHHKLRLMVLPTLEYEAVKWRIVVRILTGGIIDGDHTGELSETILKGLWEVLPHFRTAHILVRSSGRYVRGGCLVRKDKLKPQDKVPILDLVDQYNDDMKKIAKKGGLSFVSMREWMEEKFNISLQRR